MSTWKAGRGFSAFISRTNPGRARELGAADPVVDEHALLSRPSSPFGRAYARACSICRVIDFCSSATPA